MVLQIALGVLCGYVLIKVLNFVAPKIMQKIHSLQEDEAKRRVFYRKISGVWQDIKEAINDGLKDAAKLFVIAALITLLALILI